jgi:hypothetical protein
MLSTRLLLLLPLFAKAEICTKVTSWAGANYEAALNKDGVTLTSDADLIAEMGTGDLNISRIQTSSNLRVSGARFTLSSSDSSKVTPAHGVSYEGDEAPIHRDVSPTSHVTGIGVMMISDDDSIPWVTSFEYVRSPAFPPPPPSAHTPLAAASFTPTADSPETWGISLGIGTT